MPRVFKFTRGIFIILLERVDLTGEGIEYRSAGGAIYYHTVEEEELY